MIRVVRSGPFHTVTPCQVDSSNGASVIFLHLLVAHAAIAAQILRIYDRVLDLYEIDRATISLVSTAPDTRNVGRPMQIGIRQTKSTDDDQLCRIVKSHAARPIQDTTISEYRLKAAIQRTLTQLHLEPLAQAQFFPAMGELREVLVVQ